MFLMRLDYHVVIFLSELFYLILNDKLAMISSKT